jgi:hypothetical protein
MSLSPEQRSIRASIGGYAQKAKYDSRELTKNARTKFLSRFEREVDPDGVLPEPERGRRAHAALRAHMQRLALASSKARARKAGA